VVGYKPSFGTINCAGMKHLSESLDTIGVISRAVADCALLVNAISGRALPDFDAMPTPRIALCRTSRWQEASAATHAVLERTVSQLAKRGANVREIELPAHFDRLYDDQPVISGVDAARAMMPEYLAHRGLLSAHMRSQVETYADLPREQYSAAMQHARECRREFTAFRQTSGFDVLLTPSAPDEAPVGLESTGSALFNRNWTLLGLPCITLPAGRGPQGLPLGIQLVGDYDEDERLLLVAEWVRRLLD
jgi:Asp-tRNA(Asn)/Glu-tRNA(Gln) amidotransferase A subunit family amidase